MTKSQINRLGDRLRLSESPDEAALSELQEFRASYSEPMAKAQALLREVLGIEATSRLKTINTIIEKLRRERTRLATMQDIAGLRVVSKMGLAEQDELVGKITSLFPGSKMDDRRDRPSYGIGQCTSLPWLTNALSKSRFALNCKIGGRRSWRGWLTSWDGAFATEKSQSPKPPPRTLLS